jgi:hypothetical protein
MMKKKFNSKFQQLIYFSQITLNHKLLFNGRTQSTNEIVIFYQQI